jgi:hypothetical protein
MHRIISREEWGAKAGRGHALNGPLGEWVIHTEDGPDRPDAWTTAQFADAIRRIEAFHVGPSRGWNGIAYSFLIADNGDIFEGRGWLRSGSHTQGMNSKAHAICFLGSGVKTAATPAQWASAKWLIGESIRLGKVKPIPKITGHRDYSPKSCPGDKIYPLLGQLRGIRGPEDAPSPAAIEEIQEDELAARTDEELVDLFRRGVNAAGTIKGQRSFNGTLDVLVTKLAELRAQVGELKTQIDDLARVIDYDGPKAQ